MKKRGTKQIVKGRLYGRFWLGGEKRESVPVPGVDASDDAAVASRCELIADTASRLVDAGRTERARDFAVLLGAATNQKRIDAIVKEVRALIASAGVLGGGQTVKQFGERWTGGDLAREHRDHVRKKKYAKDDRQLLAKYVYPVIGSMAVRLVRLEDGERVMARLPTDLSVARRRHVAQVMSRLFTLAVYPAKLIQQNPLPKGFLPKLGAGKAKQYLYPDEDAKLMACTKVPLAERLFYGVIAREGFRFEEGLELDWDDLDLERGAVKLDVNKTDDPRAWALDQSVLHTLKRWRLLRPNLPKPFADIPNDEHQADRFRYDVQAAGIARAGLFEATENSLRLRFHDLRATFVTVSLANGKSETWVSDRTGHKSSTMIAKYQRAARTYAELGLGPLKPLAEAIVWEQDPACQTSVQRGRYVRTSARVMKGRKLRLGTEGGTRTLTPFRTADFESDCAGPDGSLHQQKRAAGHVGDPIPGAFDDGLTNLGVIERTWAAYEAAVVGMAPSEAAILDGEEGPS